MNYMHLLVLWLAIATMTNHLQAAEEAINTEEMLGERLFLETRFSQSYMKNPTQSEPVLDHTETLIGNKPGPFKGTNMSCRSCHMVDEHKDTAMAGMRSYADFARRSPVPSRQDGQTHSLRNSQSLVGISVKDNTVFHHDGEFPTLQSLIKATYIGRNMGWMSGEEKQAEQHIATIIRSDDGKGELAREFGGAYAELLRGNAADNILPEQYRIDVDKATDSEILNTIAQLVAVYVGSLDFSRDQHDQYNGSAYDAFLAKNKLPRKPKTGESDKAYAQRLYKVVQSLNSVQHVGNKDGQLKLHKQDFLFAEQELTGMRIFFGKGNCTSCHTPPTFSDFGFHNTGITQTGYDALHGQGAFMKIFIPESDARNKGSDYDHYHSIASKHKPANTDLGLWNVIGNTDITTEHRDRLANLLCTIPCTSKAALKKSIAAFKTPQLRDLGHNAPYMHDGSKDKLEDVLMHYVHVSKSARDGKLRNSNANIESVSLTKADIKPLAAFLRALNEDYE